MTSHLTLSLQIEAKRLDLLFVDGSKIGFLKAIFLNKNELKAKEKSIIFNSENLGGRV